MTKEEIEQLIEAEVGRRMGDLTAQFGRDLSEQFVAKSEVEGLMTKRLNTEAEAVKKWFKDASKDMEEGKVEDPDHPLHFIVQMLEDSADLQMDVLHIALYLLCQKADVERGPDGMRDLMNVARVQGMSKDKMAVMVRKHFKGMREAVGSQGVFANIDRLLDMIAKEPKDENPSA